MLVSFLSGKKLIRLKPNIFEGTLGTLRRDFVQVCFSNGDFSGFKEATVE
jgi:hypothetical protein